MSVALLCDDAVVCLPGHHRARTTTVMEVALGPGVGVAPWVKRAKPADKEGMLQKQGVKLLS